MKRFLNYQIVTALIALVFIGCSKEEDPTVITVQDFTATIAENSAAGTSLGSVTASTSDNSQLAYSISMQNPSDAMTINAATGELTINDAAAFDFETNPTISATVKAIANGVQEEFSATITLTDIVAKKALLIGAEGTQSWIDDVETKIEATNLFDVVDTHNSRTSLIDVNTLNTYDVVLVWTNNGPTNASGFGDNLADFIEQGGAVVEATFGGNVPITGRYNNYKVYDTTQSISQTNQSRLTYNNQNSAHPILEGISSYNGGTRSYHNTNILPGTDATEIAEYSNGDPLILVREINANGVATRGVFLNFFPPSSSIRNDFWDATTDGGKIMANALKWAGNK